MKKYGVILADPPWSYERDAVNGAALGEYNTMSIGDINAIGEQVQALAAKDSVLMLWVTWPLLIEGIALVEHWGFKYVTGFPWVKLESDPQRGLWGDLQIKPQYGVGYWVRGCTEPILIARRGKVSPPKCGSVGLISRNFQHSRKPENIYEYAESLPGPYLELFARRKRNGWDAFGNEIESDVEIETIERATV